MRIINADELIATVEKILSEQGKGQAIPGWLEEAISKTLTSSGRFVSKIWSKEDIIDRMEIKGVNYTEEMLEKVMSDNALIEVLESCLDFEWEAIDTTIDKVVEGKED